MQLFFSSRSYYDSIMTLINSVDCSRYFIIKIVVTNEYI